jgi:hypothetical protein
MEVIAEDLSTKEFAVEEDEPSIEESEVKLGRGALSERGEAVTEAGRGGLLGAG